MSDTLVDVVTATVDEALAGRRRGAGFDDTVQAVFADVVWRLHDARRSVTAGAASDAGWPAVAAASAAALPVLVTDIAGRLDMLASATGVQLADPEALAELLVRLAHASLLVPDTAPIDHAQFDGYVRRHVGPVVRQAVRAEREFGRHAVPRSRKRLRAEFLVAALIAAGVGSAGWIAVSTRTPPPSVTPANMTGSITPPEPENVVPQHFPSEIPSVLEPSPTADAPLPTLISTASPAPAAPPTSVGATAAGSGPEGSSDSDGPPNGPVMGSPPGPGGLPNVIAGLPGPGQTSKPGLPSKSGVPGAGVSGPGAGANAPGGPGAGSPGPGHAGPHGPRGR
jgi:hypothetical protein